MELLPYRYPTSSWPLTPGRSQRAWRSTQGAVRRALVRFARLTLPAPVRRWVRVKLQGGEYVPPVGWVRLGNLRRMTPLSRCYGYDRGRPIDRYYVEGFLSRRGDDISGRVLEIGDDTYTRQFGGSRVTSSDVLHMHEGNPKATIIADLTCAGHIPSATFDCIILTQTLQLLFDVRSAIATLHRILKPGGVLLATFPGISQISDGEWRDSWYWSFTSQSARRLFGESFPAEGLTVETHGNVLAATAFLQGMAAEELRREELDHHDRDYEVLITVRAVKGD
jgi:SAM-dependent methyltransferase